MKILTFLYEKVYKTIDKVIDVIVIISSAVMVLSLLLNVSSRLVIGREIPVMNEIALMSFLWVTYVCGGQLYRINAHIRIDFVLSHLPPRAREILEVINSALGVAVTGYISFLAWKLMGKSFKRTLNITHVPYAYMHLAIGIGFTCMTLYALGDFIIQIINLKRKDDPLPSCKYVPAWKARAEE